MRLSGFTRRLRLPLYVAVDAVFFINLKYLINEVKHYLIVFLRRKPPQVCKHALAGIGLVARLIAATVNAAKNLSVFHA